MKLDGKITISRVTGGDSPDEIRIRISENRSTIEFVEAVLSLEDFAAAITGQGYLPCKLDLRGLDLIGKKHENDQVRIFLKDSKSYHREEFIKAARQAAKEFEIDGWKISDYDLVPNGHRMTYEENGIWLTVPRHRYV